MKLAPFLSAVLCFFSLNALSQDAEPLKRKAYKLKLCVDKGTYYEEDLKETPYVLPDNTIQLYPGEKVFIEVDVKDGVITKMVAVEENKYPGKTLMISFKQSGVDNTHEMMLMEINNPFKMRLNYGAYIYLMQQKKWVKTTVIPVEPGLSAFETWPDIITSIGLLGWSFTV